MFRKLISIILSVFFLSGFVQADYESAYAAYEAGDYETAFKELLPLAEAGDAKAQYRLGWMYTEGLGVQQDYAEAFMWYRKAAEQGDAEAQYVLAGMYYLGQGTNQDYVQAYAWVKIAAAGEAAAGEYGPAQKTLNIFKSVLSPSQLKEARNLVRELWEKYGNKTNQ